MEIFKEVAKGNLEGLIFTLVWALNLNEYFDYVDKAVRVFEEQNAEIFYIELEASLET
jgi:hypothetical protein